MPRNTGSACSATPYTRTGYSSSLIDTGRMSPDNLFAYERAEHAVRDLRDGRVDLVHLDAQPAQAYVDQGGVKLVAKGLNPQNYAIALPKGQSSLKAELDQAITALYNDGTIAALPSATWACRRCCPHLRRGRRARRRPHLSARTAWRLSRT